MVVEHVVIDDKETIKYLGVHFDRSLTFQEETKRILKKLAAGFKTIYTIKDNSRLYEKTNSQWISFESPSLFSNYHSVYQPKTDSNT